MPDWFFKGGIAMWPLLACSILGVAIIIERAWALRRKRIISQALAEAIEKQPVDSEQLDKTKHLSEVDPSLLGELARVMFTHAAYTKSENVEAVQAVARQLVSRMERGLPALGIIVELGPLLGLVGTVLGMVRLFADVAQRGLGEATMVSQGISEALIATLTGLTVAIPALIAHGYYTRKVDNLVLTMERYSNELLTRLYHR